MSCRLCVSVCVYVCVCMFFCCLCFILELKTAEGWFFQRVHLCIWAIGGYELGTLSIRVHNSLKVHDNSWALKFDNFSEFQNVIGDSPSLSLPPSIDMSICDSPLKYTPQHSRLTIRKKRYELPVLNWITRRIYFFHQKLYQILFLTHQYKKFL